MVLGVLGGSMVFVLGGFRVFGFVLGGFRGVLGISRFRVLGF